MKTKNFLCVLCGYSSNPRIHKMSCPGPKRNDVTPKVEHTPTPWRIGDAGYTVFGPPNGNPSPETVASGLRKSNVTFIVKAVNLHDDFVRAGKMIMACWEYGDLAGAVRYLAEVLDKAEGK